MRSPHDGLFDLVERQASETPEAVFLEDARSDRTITFGELAEAVGRVSSLLDDRGIVVGRSVVVDIDDPVTFAVIHLSIVAAGRRSVPTNPDLTRTELSRIIGLLGGSVCLVTEREDRVGDEVPTILASAAFEPVESKTSRPPAEATSGSVLLFTSGSTGEPKGVELSEAQLLFVAEGIATHNRLSPEDRGYNPLPLFHINAEVVGLLASLVTGATLVLDRRFHRTGFWELLRERRITWLNAVPAILAVLARGDRIDVPNSLRFIRSASAPLPDAVRDALGDVPLVISYGMTEAASQITATSLGEPHHDGSVGLPIGCEVQVRDDDGNPAPSGQVGALWIRGPGIVDGYFEGRAADRFDDAGWLSTGDLGSIDVDGYVYLVGRSDDVINRGGEKVYPAEVEEVLLADDRVREAVVVARPDQILHEVPVAYVIVATERMSDDAAESLIADLRKRCERELPRFKRPVDISVVDDMPRASAGKIQRSRVRELAASE